MFYSTKCRGIDIVVEYVFDVTFRGSPPAPASLNYPGDPGEATEFDLTILEIVWDGGDKREVRFTKKYRDVILAEMYTSDKIAQAVDDYCRDDYDDYADYNNER